MDIEWKDIIDFENYQISNTGLVKNKKTQRILKLSCVQNTQFASLNKCGLETKVSVSKLVASHYLQKPLDNLIIVHKNLNYLDNNVSNLTYMTKSECTKYNNTMKTIGKEKIINHDIIDLNDFIDLNLNDLYMISSKGQIYSKRLKRLIYIRANREYNDVKIMVNNKRKAYFVHRLVAYAFLDFDLNSDLQINHIDGNKKNNHYSNLEIVSISENVLHSFNMLNRKKYTKPVYYIDNNQNKVIFNSITELSKHLNLDNSCVTKCCKGIYPHVKGYVIKYCE